MKRIVTIAALALMASSVLLAQARPTSSRSNAEAEQQIRRLLREWDEAYKARDAGALAGILADEFVLKDASGTVLSRTEYLMSMIKSPDFSRVESFLSEDVRVAVKRDKATVTGRSKVKGRPRGRTQAFGGDYRFTDTWMKREGRWQVVSTESTNAAADAK
jgi:ketosteroid isomerase-like protein